MKTIMIYNDLNQMNLKKKEENDVKNNDDLKTVQKSSNLCGGFALNV